MDGISKEALGNALRQLRETQQWTRAEVAKRAGFGLAIISNTEDGLQYPSVESLLRWLAVFDLSPAEFFAQFEALTTDRTIPYTAGFRKHYELLAKLLQSGDRFYIDAIFASLKGLNVAAEVETKNRAGPSKPRRASSR